MVLYITSALRVPGKKKSEKNYLWKKKKHQFTSIYKLSNTLSNTQTQIISYKSGQDNMSNEQKQWKASQRAPDIGIIKQKL